MPVSFGQAELGGGLRGSCFVGRMRKSTVEAQIIQEGQRSEVLSDAPMQPRELGLQLAVRRRRRKTLGLSN